MQFMAEISLQQTQITRLMETMFNVCKTTTNNSHLDHWSTAPSIGSSLIMSQQLFRPCFRWSAADVSSSDFLMIYQQLLKSTPNCTTHGFRSGELDGQYDNSIKSRIYVRS